MHTLRKIISVLVLGITLNLITSCYAQQNSFVYASHCSVKLGGLETELGDSYKAMCDEGTFTFFPQGNRSQKQIRTIISRLNNVGLDDLEKLVGKFVFPRTQCEVIEICRIQTETDPTTNYPRQIGPFCDRHLNCYDEEANGYFGGFSGLPMINCAQMESLENTK